MTMTRRQFLKRLAIEGVSLALAGSLPTDAFAGGDGDATDLSAAEDARRDSITVLGARGSMPVSGKKCLKYGGATTCFLVRIDGELIVLDAGTGMANLPEDTLAVPNMTLLLSHPHVDHMQGLPMCPYLSQKNACLSVYAGEHSGLDTRTQVEALFSPPLWPVVPAIMPGTCLFNNMENAFRIGSVLVEFMEGNHPGGVSIFRLTGSRKTIVFATDCTLTEENRPALTAFAKGCDVLLIDGQYSDEEWTGRESYGHSRWTDAAGFGKECETGCVKIIHHDPSHTDADLDAAEQQAGAICERCTFAREGEVIMLE